MALVLKDRVLELSTTVGTGTLTLDGAVNDFQTFSSAIGNGNTTYYTIVDDNASQWEIGLGTVGAGTLARNTVYASTNSNNLVNFAGNPKQVFCDYPASKSVNLDANGKVSFGGNTYEDFTSTTAPSYSEGRVWYDSTEKALAFYNDSSSIAVHVGQDLIFKVINNTGSTIPNGSPVYITGTSSGQTYPNVALAKADVAATSAVIGLTNGAIANGATGYVSSQGTIDNVNTSTFTVGQVLYLSPYSAGQLMNTIPPTGITVQVGVATYIDSSAGHIYVKQTTPLAVPASIITGQVAVANGGTGASTASGARTNLGLGTIATQDASAVAITGGTINGTTVGSTTPAAGTFTTITGQTGRLNGTGQNLIAYSNNFVTGWSNGAVTVTGSQSDPVGGSTASLLVPTVTNTAHYLANSTAAFSSGTTFTISVYVKASGYTLFYINDATAGLFACSYNLTAVTATPNTGCTGTITAVTGATGWYRLTLTTTGTPTSSSRATITPYASGATLTAFGATFAGDGTSGAFVYGTQVEFGSTVNTYIPTTTTAIYGTPTLSFSGVAGLGLQSDGSLYVSPAGTGALQAQATTSTTVGGNARGANAVDWQTSRASASQVASGSTSFIGGGRGNTASGQDAIVGSGYQNTASGGGQSTIAGGSFNQATAPSTFIGSGTGNQATRDYSGIVAGSNNLATGYYNFVGGGASNSGTATASVTTQSGTMNGTTAVTLSGSNANIKVGQIVAGTSITFPGTYVAAISGTSLTLSQAASGSSTSTLSFYTPHGVVVGGGNNQATGNYSFIGGGGDAGTAANRNVASGAWSTVVGGKQNTASGIGSFVGGGGTDGTFTGGNTASSSFSTVAGGFSNGATGFGSFIGSGQGNSANGTNSVISGGAFGTTRSITGNQTSPACNQPISGSQGVSQSSLLVLGVQTTDATATILRSDVSAAGTTNQVILPNNSAYYFTGEVVSGVTGGGNTKGWTIEGVIKRGANAASTALVGTPTVTSLYADAGAATWALAVTADTTNGGLKVTFTGQAATTIRTVCQIRTTEMTY